VQGDSIKNGGDTCCPRSRLENQGEEKDLVRGDKEIKGNGDVKDRGDWREEGLFTQKKKYCSKRRILGGGAPNWGERRGKARRGS